MAKRPVPPQLRAHVAKKQAAAAKNPKPHKLPPALAKHQAAKRAAAKRKGK